VVAVLPAPFAELDVVEQHEQHALAGVEEPGEVAVPGQIGWLVCDQHARLRVGPHQSANL
jgi:hypothetical protein